MNFNQFQAHGFEILPTLYQPAEVARIRQRVADALSDGLDPELTREIFIVHGILDAAPGLWALLNTQSLRILLAQLYPEGCQVVKAMYFDKPSLLNWRVAWHQDLLINVNRRTALPGFGPWTRKPEGLSVQPPVAVLENICVLRLHLDDCDADNGALKVAPGSHRHGVVPAVAMAALVTEPTVCAVPAGNVMLTKPLLLHASSPHTSDRPRRVLHLEFSSVKLPHGLDWREHWPVEGT